MTPRRRIFRLVIVHSLTQNLSLKCCFDLIIFNIHRHGCRIFLDYSLRPSERCFSFWSWSPPRANVKNQNGRPAERKKEQRWEIWGLGGQTDVGLGGGRERQENRPPLSSSCHLYCLMAPLLWDCPRRDINSNHQFHHSRQLTQAANIVEPVTRFTLYMRSGQIRGWIYVCPTNHTILKAILQISLIHHRFLLTIDQENHIDFILVNNQFSQMTYDIKV